MGCLCREIAGPDMELSSTCLGQLWMFDNLAQSDVVELVKEAKRKKLAKGEQLFMQSDPADELFLIKAGRIKLVKVFEDGNELTLDIRKDGDFVGENIFSEDGQYPVSAVCLQDTLTCGFNKEQFEQLILRNPNIGLQVIKNLSERISWLTSRVGNLTVTNIEERLYRVLCNVAKEHGASSSRGVVIQFPLTHEDLGFLTGAHRVSITRAMSALKQAGKIILEGKRLILPALA
ncbi:MAG: Crp/Fnr family transcriptional regulator [Desulfocapsaceae bacterium]